MNSKYTAKENKTHINLVLKNAISCNISMANNNIPYMVTVNFGYDSDYIYFHSNQKGTKVDMINSNPLVCYGLHYGVEVFSNKQACNWGTKYRSISGTGKAELLTNEDDKTNGLLAIMQKYSGSNEHVFNEHILDHTNVYRISLKNATVKNNHWDWDWDE